MEYTETNKLPHDKTAQSDQSLHCLHEESLGS